MTSWLTTILIFLPIAGAARRLAGAAAESRGSPRSRRSSRSSRSASGSSRSRSSTSRAARLQLEQQHTWFTAIGSSYHVGPVRLLALARRADRDLRRGGEHVRLVGRPRARRSAYFGLLLFLTGSVVGVFAVAGPAALLRLLRGDADPALRADRRLGRRRAGCGATITFVVYTVAGSLLMLAAIIVYGSQQGTFDLTKLSPSTNDWLFLGFAIAFAIKAPLWPFHGWLPDAYRESPPEVSGLLSGVISKVAVYGFLRIAIAKFPGPAHHFRVLDPRARGDRARLRLAARLPRARHPRRDRVLLARADGADHASASSPPTTSASTAPCCRWSTTACSR